MSITKHNPLPTPQEIVAHLDRFVYGQHQAKRDLAIAVYNHYLGLGYLDHHRAEDDASGTRPDSVFGKQHILLMGPTGSGKTYLIRLIAELLGVPWTFIAATSLVQTGYVGTRIENAIGSLYQRANRDSDLAERGIVLIDEIDKIAAHRGSSGPDVGGEGVQQSLLSVLDGRVVMASTGGSSDQPLGEIDTASILFVCAGAFVGLDGQARRRRQGVGIGFTMTQSVGARGAHAVIAPADVDFLDNLPDTEDLVEYGFIPEFVGRFATISATQALTADDLVSVLEQTEDSILPRQRRLFEVHGIDLEFTPDALRAVAEDACALGTGARGLSRVVLRSLADIDYRLPELAAQGVVRVTVTADTVRGRGEPGLKRPRSRAGSSRANLAEDLRAHALRAAPRNAEAGSRAAPATAARRAFTDPRGLEPQEIRARLEEAKELAGWLETTGSARKWWESFEKDNASQLHIALRCAEELRERKATITEFFLAYVYSNTENIQSVLHFLDYTRTKKEWEQSRKKKTG